MALPGASTSPSGSEASLREAHAAGVRAVELVRQDIRPRDIIANAGKRGTDIRTVTNPLFANGSFSVVTGSLAPVGAVIKTSAATASLFTHTGPALVCDNYDDMRGRIDDPERNVTA